MDISSKLIIFPLILLHILCMPKMSTSKECCKTELCKSRSSLYVHSISIESPFRLEGHQPESCGCPGFGLFCDNELGPLLELPNAGNLTVDNINYYYTKEIVLSDPNNCLPQKLLSLDLTATPFKGLGHNEEFWVYNCSGIGHDLDLLIYDEIGCMNGSNYTIVSVTAGTNVTNPFCSLVKSVVFQAEFSMSYLSSYSNLYLTWDEQDCESCYTRNDSTNNSGLGIVALPIVAFVMIFAVVSYCMCKAQSSRGSEEVQAAVVTAANTDHVVSHTQPSSGGHGLDQNTINSYPIVVISNIGCLVKPDDDKCSICLSDYELGDTLKLLPECVHRFHADCIDLWLSAKITCPICRTPPPRNSQV